MSDSFLALTTHRLFKAGCLSKSLPYLIAYQYAISRLALAGLYLTRSPMLRLYDWQLFDTTNEYIEAVRDAFISMPKKAPEVSELYIGVRREAYLKA